MALNENREPMRRCIGCMKSHPQNEMIRFTCKGERIYEDKAGREDGRGVYLCKNETCITKARKSRAFNRSFKKSLELGQVDKLLDEVLEDLRR